MAAELQGGATERFTSVSDAPSHRLEPASDGKVGEEAGNWHFMRGFNPSTAKRLAPGAPGRPFSVADPVFASSEAGYETSGSDTLAPPSSTKQAQDDFAAILNEAQGGGDDWVIVEDMPMISDTSIMEGGGEGAEHVQPNSLLPRRSMLNDEELPTLVTLLEFVSFITEG